MSYDETEPVTGYEDIIDSSARDALSTADSIVTIFETTADGEQPEAAGEAALELLAATDPAQFPLMILHLAERLAETR
jgi:hypothetical protein